MQVTLQNWIDCKPLPSTERHCITGFGLWLKQFKLWQTNPRRPVGAKLFPLLDDAAFLVVLQLSLVELTDSVWKLTGMLSACGEV